MAAPIARTALGLDLPAAPRRLVSLVPSLTETLYDLGAGERIVGVTDWCGPALPAGATPARFGGVRDPRLDELLALEPDLVLASREENLREHVEAIAAASVPVLLADPRDLDDAATLVMEVGEAIGEGERAVVLATHIRARRGPGRSGQSSRVRVIYPIWNDPWMTVGTGSYAASVLAAAGFDLVGAAAESPYPPLDLDRAAASRPQGLLLPDEPFDFHGTGRAMLVDALAARGLAQLAAVEVDGRLAAWYGSRSGQRLAELTALCTRMA
jgi:ABC-type Fe3+-hydroxamate transport system substrate-binding protein